MIVQDLTYAIRSFARNRGFTAAAMLSLALGIGVNTAIFSVVSALLLQPLPYRDPGRLVILWNRSPGLNITQDWFSTAQYFDVKAGHHGFAQLAIAIGGNYNLTGDGDPERIGATRISANLLPMLGGRASMGRLFLPEEDSPGPPATCVLSYGMWERRYGRDPRILGRSLTLNGQSYSIAGVLSRDFALPREVLPTLYGTDQTEILLPLPLGLAAANQRNHEDYNIVGTLRPGVTVPEAQAEMDTLTARLRHDYPDLYPPNSGLTFSIVPLLEQVVGDVRRPLLVLLGAVGFVLLIACANVANLLLARAVARQKEIAIRMALGAGRRRVTRQLLTESVLLAIAGGALGVLLAEWFVVGLRVVGTKSVPRLAEISIDRRVLAFTLLISLCSGILFGLAPALRGSRLDLNSTLKDAARGSAGGGHNMRALLVVSQLAIAAVLAIGAGLLIRSFYRLQQTPAGFNPAHVLTLELTMTGRKYDDRQAVLRGYRELWERLDHMSGVTASGAVSALPLSQMYSWGPITVEGRTPPPGEGFFNADQRIVAGRYFETMQIPLVRGRLFDERDTLDTPRIAIVDEYMAGQLWPGENPVGKRIRLGRLNSTAPWVTVAGVVGRIKQDKLDSDPRIAVYLPQTQFPQRSMTVVVRTAGDPSLLTAAVKRELHTLDPDLPMYSVETMDQRVGQSLATRRFSMVLLTLFAALALTLSGIGAYGAMAYLVSQTTRDIGIRMALGATQSNILGVVVWRGLRLALAGVAIGVAGAYALSHVMKSLLFGIAPTDAVTYAGTCLLLLTIGLSASYFPARQAARTDPSVSLRCE